MALWDEVMGQHMDGDFDLLLGRFTYDIFAAHWPFQQDDPIGAKFDAVTKYVVTSSTEPLGWINSVAIKGDAAAGVARIATRRYPIFQSFVLTAARHRLPKRISRWPAKRERCRTTF